MYPAKEVVGGVDCGGVVSAGGCCCGGSWTGTPVRESKKGGIIESDCDGGERIRRRRGLAMCLGVDFEGSAGGLADAEAMMQWRWEGRRRGRAAK